MEIEAKGTYRDLVNMMLVEPHINEAFNFDRGSLSSKNNLGERQSGCDNTRTPDSYTTIKLMLVSEQDDPVYVEVFSNRLRYNIHMDIRDLELTNNDLIVYNNKYYCGKNEIESAVYHGMASQLTCAYNNATAYDSKQQLRNFLTASSRKQACPVDERHYRPGRYDKQGNYVGSTQ